ncbi:unnamed protein product [Orchesella dallaii]|uniref:Ig-like domain-containing protein n=1 Tax=Orchesella dallaii TaxID=48710 RepID=A0ABP1PRH7_9HEXA
MGAKCCKTDKQEEERLRRAILLQQTSSTLLDRYASLSPQHPGTRPQSSVSTTQQEYSTRSPTPGIRRTQSTQIPQDYYRPHSSQSDYNFRSSSNTIYPLNISEIRGNESTLPRNLSRSPSAPPRKSRKLTGSSGFFEDFSTSSYQQVSSSSNPPTHESLPLDAPPATPPRRRRKDSSASERSSKRISEVPDLPPTPPVREVSTKRKIKTMTLIERDTAPGFVRNLTDVAVKVGTRTRLLAEINPNTKDQDEVMKVSWFRNDQKITFPTDGTTRIRQTSEGRFHYLDISPVLTDDEGKWICLAENFHGRTSSTCFVKVMVPKSYRPPEFVESLKAVLTEAGTVSLECKVIGTPTPLLKWYKDGVEIKAGDIFALRGDASSLGVYTCEATNCMGSVTSSSRVHMNDQSTSPLPGSIQITSSLLDSRVRVGEKIEFQVQINKQFDETLKVNWYNKSVLIPASERVQQITSSSVCACTINPVEVQDDGEWTCEIVSATNEKVRVTNSCVLSILIPRNYRKPKFLEDLKAILTEEGLVSFECKVCGFPTPILHWYKDGYELKPGDVYQLSGANSLGRYSCVAHNCMGDAESSTELTLEDIQHQLSDDERKQLIAEGIASKRPPKFVKGLKSVEVKIGDPCELQVQLNDPKSTVSWFRDSVCVDTEERYVLRNEGGGVHTLLIQELEFDDQAEWKCTGTNEYGHSVSTAGLKLIIPSTYKKPKFLESLRAVLSEEGTVNLECKVIGVPVPVLKWYKDGVELKAGDIHRIISGADGTCCLGTYTCVAKNCMGEVSSSAALLGFEDKLEKDAQQQKADAQRAAANLTRDPSLSTIMEERTSQMLSVYETPASLVPRSIEEEDRALAGAADISVSIDGKDVSVSLYETPDLTENDAKQIIEMFANEYSEYISEHNVVPLPSLRFVKETSTSGNIVMEAVLIDVTEDPFDTAKSASMGGAVIREDPTEADYDDEFSDSFESPMELSATSDPPERGLRSRTSSLREKRKHSEQSLSRRSSEKKRRSEERAQQQNSAAERGSQAKEDATSVYLSANSDNEMDVKRATPKSEIDAMSERLEALEEFEKLMSQKIAMGELLQPYEVQENIPLSNIETLKMDDEQLRNVPEYSPMVGLDLGVHEQQVLYETYESFGTPQSMKKEMGELGFAQHHEALQQFGADPFSNVGEFEQQLESLKQAEANIFGGERFVGIEMAEMVLEGADTFSDVDSIPATIAMEQMQSSEGVLASDVVEAWEQSVREDVVEEKTAAGIVAARKKKAQLEALESQQTLQGVQMLEAEHSRLLEGAKAQSATVEEKTVRKKHSIGTGQALSMEEYKCEVQTQKKSEQATMQMQMEEEIWVKAEEGQITAGESKELGEKEAGAKQIGDQQIKKSDLKTTEESQKIAQVKVEQLKTSQKAEISIESEEQAQQQEALQGKGARKDSKGGQEGKQVDEVKQKSDTTKKASEEESKVQIDDVKQAGLKKADEAKAEQGEKRRESTTQQDAQQKSKQEEVTQKQPTVAKNAEEENKKVNEAKKADETKKQQAEEVGNKADVATAKVEETKKKQEDEGMKAEDAKQKQLEGEKKQVDAKRKESVDTTQVEDKNKEEEEKKKAEAKKKVDDKQPEAKKTEEDEKKQVDSKKKAEDEKKQTETKEKEEEDSKKKADEEKKQTEAKKKEEETKKQAEKKKKEEEETKKKAEEEKKRADAKVKDEEERKLAEAKKKEEEEKKQAEAKKKEEEEKKKAEAKKKEEEEKKQADAKKKEDEEKKQAEVKKKEEEKKKQAEAKKKEEEEKKQAEAKKKEEEEKKKAEARKKEEEEKKQADAKKKEEEEKKQAEAKKKEEEEKTKAEAKKKEEEEKKKKAEEEKKQAEAKKKEEEEKKQAEAKKKEEEEKKQAEAKKKEEEEKKQAEAKKKEEEEKKKAEAKKKEDEEKKQAESKKKEEEEKKQTEAKKKEEEEKKKKAEEDKKQAEAKKKEEEEKKKTEAKKKEEEEKKQADAKKKEEEEKKKKAEEDTKKKAEEEAKKKAEEEKKKKAEEEAIKAEEEKKKKAEEDKKKKAEEEAKKTEEEKKKKAEEAAKKAEAEKQKKAEEEAKKKAEEEKKKKAEEEANKKVEEEKKKKAEEEANKKVEEEKKKKAEEEAKKKAEEEAKKVEEEKKKKAEEEANKKVEEEKKKKKKAEVEAIKKAEEEAKKSQEEKKKKAEEEAKKAEEEKKKKAEEEAKKAEEEAKKAEEEKKKKSEEEAKKKKEDEEKKKKAEEEKKIADSKKKEEDEKKKAEEAKTKAEEEKKKKAEEEATKKAEAEKKKKAEESKTKAEEEKKKKAEEEAKKKAEEEAMKKAEEEAMKKAEEEKKKKAEEEAKKKAEEEAMKKAEEEKKKKAEEEAKKKAEDEKKKKAEEEAKKKAEDEKKKKAEEEAKKKAEDEKKKKAEEEAKKKAEDEKKKKAEEEAKKKAEDEKKKKAEEEKKLADSKKKEEDEKKKAEEEAKKKAEDEKKAKISEEAKNKADEETKKKVDADAKKAEEEKKATEERKKSDAGKKVEDPKKTETDPKKAEDSKNSEEEKKKEEATKSTDAESKKADGKKQEDSNTKDGQDEGKKAAEPDSKRSSLEDNKLKIKTVKKVNKIELQSLKLDGDIKVQTDAPSTPTTKKPTSPTDKDAQAKQDEATARKDSLTEAAKRKASVTETKKVEEVKLEGKKTAETKGSGTSTPDRKDSIKEPASKTPDRKDSVKEPAAKTPERKDSVKEPATKTPDRKDSTKESTAKTPDRKDSAKESSAKTPDRKDSVKEPAGKTPDRKDSTPSTKTPDRKDSTTAERKDSTPSGKNSERKDSATALKTPDRKDSTTPKAAESKESSTKPADKKDSVKKDAVKKGSVKEETSTEAKVTTTKVSAKDEAPGKESSTGSPEPVISKPPRDKKRDSVKSPEKEQVVRKTQVAETQESSSFVRHTEGISRESRTSEKDNFSKRGGQSQPTSAPEGFTSTVSVRSSTVDNKQDYKSTDRVSTTADRGITTSYDRGTAPTTTGDKRTTFDKTATTYDRGTSSHERLASSSYDRLVTTYELDRASSPSLPRALDALSALDTRPRTPHLHDQADITYKYNKRSHEMQPSYRLSERAKSWDHLPGYSHGQDTYSADRGVVVCGGPTIRPASYIPSITRTLPRDYESHQERSKLRSLEDLSLMEQTHQFSRELRQQQVKAMQRKWKTTDEDSLAELDELPSHECVSPPPAVPPRYKRRNNYQIKVSSEAEDIYGRDIVEKPTFQMPSYFTTPSVGYSYFSMASLSSSGSFASLDEAHRLRRPRFSMKLSNRTTSENTEVVKFACTVFGTPDPTIQWYKNGLPIFSDRQKYVITTNCGVCTLDVHDLDSHDTGEYTCFARNFYGKAASSAILKVESISEHRKTLLPELTHGSVSYDKCIPVNFTTGIMETNFPEVNELVLECQVKGNPKPEIMWMKNGQSIISYGQTTYGRFRADYANIFETGKCRLIIQRPRESDSGVYTCVGRNYDHSAVGRKLHWSDEITKCVNVKGGNTSPKGLGSMIMNPNFEYQSPRFISELEPFKHVHVGREIVLTVEVAGVPNPEVRWFHHKNSIYPIKPTSHVRVVNESPGNHTLYIPETDPFDFGTYTVRVSNKYGMVESSCCITEVVQGINDSPTLSGLSKRKSFDLQNVPPMFTREPRENILLKYGDELVIECEVEGWPQVTVNLYRGCRNVILQPRAYKELNPPVAASSADTHQKVKFTLTNLHCTDFGMYTVEAKNIVGMAKAFVNVKVLDPEGGLRTARSMTPSSRRASPSSSSHYLYSGSTSNLRSLDTFLATTRSISTRSLLHHTTYRPSSSYRKLSCSSHVLAREY